MAQAGAATSVQAAVSDDTGDPARNELTAEESPAPAISSNLCRRNHLAKTAACWGVQRDVALEARLFRGMWRRVQMDMAQIELTR